MRKPRRRERADPDADLPVSRLQRRSRKAWRRIHKVASRLPAGACQRVHYLLWYLRPLPLRRPRTYTQRVFAKMARDRDPLLTTTTDKLAVRGYAEQRVGDGHLTELYAVLDDPEALLDISLPPRYVVKPTHGSGMREIVLTDSPQRRASVAASARRWLAREYWRRNGEWAYKGVTPRILVEEFLDAGGGQPPTDWKWFCFGGKAELVEAIIDRLGACMRTFYTVEGEYLDLRQFHRRWPAVAVPPTLGSMRKLAERLSEPFEFVRVDLYALGERIVVGELTHYPTAGHKPLDPPEWEVRLGAVWA
ncbi:MAG: ATP-grasp fold amidoligase family protein, partial [Candidatus Binatia bacterium]